MEEVGIGRITWSDHAPFFFKYNLSDTQLPGSATWKLNESLLQDTSVLENVRREAIEYFQTKDTPNCDPGVIWEPHKAVIRGVLIKHGQGLKG